MNKLCLGILMVFFFGQFSFAQDQILLQEDFNNGLPVQWQSQSVTGNNQWQITDNGGLNIDGTDMAYIESIPNQVSVTDLLLPPLQSDPGINSIFLEFELQQSSSHPTFLKIILFENGNPIPQELDVFDLPPCDPLNPWNCPPQPVIVELPGQLDPQDQLLLQFESPFGFPQIDFIAIDNLSILGFFGCPIWLVSQNTTAPLCSGGLGTIALTAGGLFPPLSYSLNGGPSQGFGGFNAPPGTHVITVIDAFNCSENFTVVVPAAPQSIGLNSNLFPPSCFGLADAQIIATANGGTPGPAGYNYSLDGGPVQNNGNFNTTAGPHVLTVVDGNGCTVNFNLNVPDTPDITLASTFDPVCPNDMDVDLAVTANGGPVNQYSYSLNGGPALGIGNFPMLPLNAGITITVTSGLCMKDFNLLTPTNEDIFNLNPFNQPCFGGGNNGTIKAVTLFPNNEADMEYSFNGGAFANVTEWNNLTAGMYTVIGKNTSTGCEQTKMIDLQEDPPLFTIFDTSISNTTCANSNDGSIAITNPLVSFELSGSELENSPVAGNAWNDLEPGLYTLTGTDGECTHSLDITITAPEGPSLLLDVTDVTCFGENDGSVQAIIDQNHDVRLDNGIWFNGPIHLFENVIPGLHTATVREAPGGCTTSLQITILEPAEINATAVIANADNADGSIDLNVSGGTPSYMYLWSNGETTEDINGLVVGNYSVLITDQNDCVANFSFEVLPACNALEFSSQAQNLMVDQSIDGGTKTQLLWDHYSDRTDGCLIRGGTIASLDPSAPFTQNPGNILIQGAMVDGNANGQDFSAQLPPNAQYQLFNPNTFPSGLTSNLIPGALYKFQVRCGCIIDPSISGPARFANSNVYISPWSDFEVFTNLPILPFVDDGSLSDIKLLDSGYISVYPNPTNKILNIKLNDEMDETFSIHVYDMRGARLDVEIAIEKNGTSSIDLSSFANGLYLVDVVTSNEHHLVKVVKE